MALGSVSLNVAQLAEAVYLGIVGTEALAAMGFAFPITITLFAFAGGIGTGASSVIARVIGAGKRERAAQLVTHAHILTVFIGIVLGLTGGMLAEEIAIALGARATVQTMTVEYLQVYMLGFPFFMLGMVGSTLLRATGSAASPGVVMAIGSLLQILMGPVLIFGWLGFPALGIAGAAWAYVASRTVSVAIYAALLIRVRMLQWSFHGLAQSWRDILHVGAPAIASGLIMPVSMLIITRLLALHGHEVVAGYNVASRVETLAHMILWSASSSIEPFAGQNWGAGNYDRVKRALSLCNRFCLAWGVFTFAMMMLFGRMIVFAIDDNPVVGEVAWAFFLIIPLSIGFMGIMQIANSCFNARGLPMPPLILAVVRTFVFYIPLAIWADSVWGYVGIFLATAFTNVVLGGFAWWWNRDSVERTSARAAAA
ncbi:MAG: MATE family efflux transporter [Pseudomonadales bacterium]|jgi:putative MATE family efflux protein|nr:MATE family efflux transporter [Pseudomonadales bacterium]MDP6826581.1 MATE family efflux transporter [Pseudomonadales bacterium]